MPKPSIPKVSQAAGRDRPQQLAESPLDSWDQAWLLWLDRKASQHRAPKTMANFRWAKTWIDHFRHDPANRISSPRAWTARHTTEFMLWLTEAQLSPSAVNKIVNHSLIQFLAWCARDEHEPDLPWRIERRPDRREISDDRPDRDAYPKLNETEMSVALSQASPRDRFLLTLLACTGLRIGEVGAARTEEEANLRLEDMELNSGTARWELNVWTLKPPRQRRRVPVDPRLKRLWDVYVQEVRPKDHIGIDAKTGLPWDAVFLTSRLDRGTYLPMTTSALQDTIKSLKQGPKPVPRLHPHILRHTFGRNMAHVVTPFQLAAIMGHKDVRTTMIYAGLEGLEGEFRQRSALEYAWLDAEVAMLRPARSQRAIPSIRRRAASPT